MSERPATLRLVVEPRPTHDEHLSGQELLRWYWLRTELADLARALGVSASGSKQALTARLVARLDGQPLPPPPPTPPPPPPALPEPLTAATVIPVGQRCSQQLRRYFTDAIGSTFVFDARMRDFISTSPGRTLGDAEAHWHTTRSQPKSDIGKQFELNVFLRRFHDQQPGQSHAEALDAWRTYRRLPAEARGRPSDGQP